MKGCRFVILVLCLAMMLCTCTVAERDSRVIFSGSGGEKKIALTFDDGPHRTKTAQILALLEEYNVKATFFIVGSNARNYPDIIRAEIEGGHELGNHTFYHSCLSKCSGERIRAEISQTEDSLMEIAGYQPKLFRPPEGAYSHKVVEIATSMDYSIILWTVDTRDWAKASTAQIVANVSANVREGSIILFHDFTVSGTHTVDALKILIPKLLSEGYEFVTVSELISDAG